MAAIHPVLTGLLTLFLTSTSFAGIELSKTTNGTSAAGTVAAATLLGALRNDSMQPPGNCSGNSSAINGSGDTRGIRDSKGKAPWSKRASQSKSDHRQQPPSLLCPNDTQPSHTPHQRPGNSKNNTAREPHREAVKQQSSGATATPRADWQLAAQNQFDSTGKAMTRRQAKRQIPEGSYTVLTSQTFAAIDE